MKFAPRAHITKIMAPPLSVETTSSASCNVPIDPEQDLEVPTVKPALDGPGNGSGSNEADSGSTDEPESSIEKPPICLVLLYNETSSAAYFKTDLPTELEGLVSERLHAFRIHTLNREIAKLRYGPQEYMPHVRACILAVFVALSVAINLTLDEARGVALWCFALAGMFVLLLCTYQRRALYEQYCHEKMRQFNVHDGAIALEWKFQRPEPAFVSLDFSEEVTRIHWMIVIRHVNRDSGENGGFLPVYEGDILEEREGADKEESVKPPSYIPPQ
ncbi:hypothetical protein BC830DRAFT_159035 [Chytriomyces sp. MP71]|nr:hypothetical protein BC830DRAFT_159035 [Chytriomyces sp. MP71]